MMIASKKLYGRRWQRARLWYLQRNPLCVMCMDKTPSEIAAAHVVDHIVRHMGNVRLFWDSNNWQGLCYTCHNSTKQKQEKADERVGCDADGFPLDVEW